MLEMKVRNMKALEEQIANQLKSLDYDEAETRKRIDDEEFAERDKRQKLDHNNELPVQNKHAVIEQKIDEQK